MHTQILTKQCLQQTKMLFVYLFYIHCWMYCVPYYILVNIYNTQRESFCRRILLIYFEKLKKKITFSLLCFYTIKSNLLCVYVYASSHHIENIILHLTLYKTVSTLFFVCTLQMILGIRQESRICCFQSKGSLNIRVYSYSVQIYEYEKTLKNGFAIKTQNVKRTTHAQIDIKQGWLGNIILYLHTSRIL